MSRKREIRGRLRDAVSRIQELDDELAELSEDLALPVDVEEMWEGALPRSFEANLYAALEAVRSDCLQDAVATLLTATRQSESSLRSEFSRPLPCAGLGASQELDLLDWFGSKKGGVPFQVKQNSPGQAGGKGTPPCSD